MLWEVIRKNKIKSAIALILMAVWFSCFYAYIWQFIGWAVKQNLKLPLSPFCIGVIIFLSIFAACFLYMKSRPYKISGFKLYKASRKENPRLYNIAEEIAIAAGIKKIPELYILNSKFLNAYACGLNPDKSSIVISKGLLEQLNRDELQAVTAHEMSHIINRDTMYLLCSGLLFEISKAFSEDAFKLILELVSILCHALNFYIFIIIFIMLLLLPFALIGFIGQGICYILFTFISKQREYLADACAVLYTRNPGALASAMRKMEQASKNNIYQKAAEKTNPLIKASFFASVKGDKTHPETENRIKILYEMKSADLNEYERIYEKLKGKNLLPKSALKNAAKIDIIARRADEGFNEAVYSACSLNNIIDNKEQIKTLRENKALLKENIKKHREAENLVRNLAEYKEINCTCGTKLKIPPVYKNQIIICPHCGRKHTI